MENYSNKSLIHVRLKNFVLWIAADKDKRESIKNQSDEIRNRIKAKAEEDGLTIVSMPYSGSFAKKTGLRRHYHGAVPIDGQDIDIPFVVKKDKETDFEPLIRRFEKYARASYPKTDIVPTKSSIKMSFTGTKLSYDIVPMFETSDPEKQTFIRENGDVITTSIGKHKDFIRSRIQESNDEEGVVLFNDCIRLIKWWREVKVNDAKGSIKEIPSFLIDLLAAKAHDKLGVDTTYPQTIANWFNYLASIIKKRETIWFNDYYKTPKADTTKPWNVLDPVMPDNNVVQKWQGYQIDELTAWFQEASEKINKAMVADLMGEDAESLQMLNEVFGTVFQSHCE
jgi:hypothetical protein